MLPLTDNVRAITTAYGLLAVAGIVAAIIAPPTALLLLFKAMPAGFLVFLLARSPGVSTDYYQRFILFGLGASVTADVVIELWFPGGLAIFLLAHVFYITAMQLPLRPFPLHPGVIVAGLVFGAVMLALLLPRVPQAMCIPVLVYMSVILLMFTRAWTRVLTHGGQAGVWLMGIGALLFVISDSLIGINRWVVDIPHERIAILGTYFAAQWFICQSALTGNHTAEA